MSKPVIGDICYIKNDVFHVLASDENEDGLTVRLKAVEARSGEAVNFYVFLFFGLSALGVFGLANVIRRLFS